MFAKHLVHSAVPLASRSWSLLHTTNRTYRRLAANISNKVEDPKVLRRSSDLLYNVKLGQGK